MNARHSGSLTVRGLSKSFSRADPPPAESGAWALRNIDLDIQAGEFICLLGPSGCGKSTLLNAMAGFVTPTLGEVAMDGAPVRGPGPERGMVFQDYALFPWMTVRRNIAFGLENKGMPKASIDSRVDALLETLSLRGFGERFPKELSGGMKQRVAIARLLALDSPVLLMDEPFGALDALTRRSLQEELLRIWSGSGKTVVFVTHAIDEAVLLADRIVVLTYRPGTIKAIVPVPLPRPRDPSSDAFNRLKAQLDVSVMEEQHRHEWDEIH